MTLHQRCTFAEELGPSHVLEGFILRRCRCGRIKTFKGSASGVHLGAGVDGTDSQADGEVRERVRPVGKAVGG